MSMESAGGVDRRHSASRSRATSRTFVLRVELRDTQPCIWRRIALPADFTLHRVHYALQIAMGWTDSHLHDFEADEVRYGVPHPEDYVPLRDERRAKLSSVLRRPGDELTYQYDFGDSWEHRVLLELVHDTPVDLPWPIVLGGARACPPEDVGGTGCYEDFLQAIVDPAHKQHAELLEWCGGGFDPEAFDPDAVNDALREHFAPRVPARRARRKAKARTAPPASSAPNAAAAATVPGEHASLSLAAASAAAGLPASGPGAWLALLQAAFRFRDAAPWEWLLDSDMIGVRDPVTGETGWCCALGAAGRFFGLGIYRGDEGFHVHRLLHARTVDPEQAPYMQKAIVVDFTDSKGLDKESRERLRTLGITCRGRNAWPRIEDHEPGFVPRPLQEQDVRLATLALEQALDAFLRARRDRSLVSPDDRGRLLVRVLDRGAGGKADGAASNAAGESAGVSAWVDAREPPPPPLPPEPAAQLDETALQRLRAERPRVDATLEFDVRHAPVIISEHNPRPWFALVALLVDAEAGTIASVDIVKPSLTAQLHADLLVKALAALPARPRRLRVASERARLALAPVAQRLDIELQQARALPALEQALRSLIGAMGRR